MNDADTKKLVASLSCLLCFVIGFLLSFFVLIPSQLTSSGAGAGAMGIGFFWDFAYPFAVGLSTLTVGGLLWGLLVFAYRALR